MLLILHILIITTTDLHATGGISRFTTRELDGLVDQSIPVYYSRIIIYCSRPRQAKTESAHLRPRAVR